MGRKMLFGARLNMCTAKLLPNEDIPAGRVFINAGLAVGDGPRGWGWWNGLGREGRMMTTTTQERKRTPGHE